MYHSKNVQEVVSICEPYENSILFNCAQYCATPLASLHTVRDLHFFFFLLIHIILYVYLHNFWFIVVTGQQRWFQALVTSRNSTTNQAACSALHLNNNMWDSNIFPPSSNPYHFYCTLICMVSGLLFCRG